jgi:hypothetical protein
MILNLARLPEMVLNSALLMMLSLGTNPLKIRHWVQPIINLNKKEQYKAILWENLNALNS